MTHTYPKALGFSMPAEWAPHEATWLAWPHNDELWMGYLEPVREEFANLINVIAEHERVELLVNDEECETDAKRRLKGNIRFHQIQYSDVWLRDSGPIFIKDKQDTLLITDWEFNGWGNKYSAYPDNDIAKKVAAFLNASYVSAGIVMEGGSLEPNGEGVFLTTEQCLFSKERNPTLNRSQLEEMLQNYLSASEVIWLKDGLENDHTDGHIDTITRFTSPTSIVTCVSEDTNDYNYEVMERNLEILSPLSKRGFQITKLVLPKKRLELEGERVAATYANFYICNGSVIVPIYSDVNDERALETLRPLFPGRKVIGLSGQSLITGGGSFHCVTQQQPKGIFRKVAL